MGRTGLLRDAAITAGAVLLTFGALDDITTDNATGGFLPERIALFACTGWFLFAAWRVMQAGYRHFGRLSIAVAATAAVAQWVVRRDNVPSVRIAYLVAIFGLVWFAILSAFLAWRGLERAVRNSVKSPQA